MVLGFSDVPGEREDVLPAAPPANEPPPPALRACWEVLSSRPPRITVPAEPLFAPYDAVLVVDAARESQFDALLAHLRHAPGPAPTVAALALTGEKFHGHRGRAWAARRGNLHLSACFPVGRALGATAVALTALPAVAVLDALAGLAAPGLRAGIKWVNDILVDGAKVAGVITATQVKGALTQSVVFGIGLNVRVAPEVPPTVFVPRAGCLADTLGPGTPVLGAVFAAVAGALAARVREYLEQGPGSALAAYRRGSLLTGRAVRVWEESTVDALADLRRAAPPRRGVVAGIADDLSLLLEGDPLPVARGRLALEEACGPLAG